ncbi:hypothetical protein Tco_0804562 [Tanacetum coccineum]|uniref:Secreted protein n=1 Tax=Tanacetum coccineum TaxID=301880 RepID=A0ABQ5A4N0_9ASTR
MMVQQALNLVMGILLVIVDEQLVLGIIVDGQVVVDVIAAEPLVVHMIVVVEEVNRIVVVEELLKTVNGTEMDCIEVDSLRIFSASVRSSKVLGLVDASVVGVAGISTVPN